MNFADEGRGKGRRERKRDGRETHPYLEFWKNKKGGKKKFEGDPILIQFDSPTPPSPPRRTEETAPYFFWWFWQEVGCDLVPLVVQW